VSDQENMANKHVDEFTLMMYVERQLDREAAQEVSLHTQTCTRCLTLLRALDRESRLLTRSMLEQDEPLPARLAEFHAKVKRSMQWIWGLVFGLAVVGVYALYSSYIEPWQRQLEQAGFGGSNLLSLLVFQGAFWKGWQSMITLVEFVALASVAGFGLFAIRRYLRRGTALAVMFASLGFVASIVPPASAQEMDFDMHKGASFEVKKDEVWNKDLFFSGQHLKVAGTVNGDVYVFAQQMEISGHVNGDVICFAQSARITGQVDGNVRAFTNNITITGTVDRSVTAFNEVFTLDSGGRVGRSLLLFAQSMTLDGKMDRDVRAFCAQCSLGGAVAGNFKVKGDSLTINSSAQIDGHTSYEGQKPADVASGAKLASPLEFKKMEHKYETPRSTGYYVWRIIWAAAYVLFGLVLISAMPLFSREATQNVESVGASFGLGVLVGFAVPIAAVIACITVVGLFVGLSALFLWYGCLYFAQVIVGAAVGQWILGRATETWGLIGRMAIGILILRACMAIPYLGIWVKIGVIIWGVGAISLAVYRRFEPAIAPNIPSAPLTPATMPLPPNTTVGGN
jgi:cytoskeletal protein CcmA (bactofilin family)